MTQTTVAPIKDDEAKAAGGRAAQRRSFKRGVSLAAWARLSPDRLAITSAHGNRTFRDLDENCNRLARALSQLGLTPDDGLALLCGNRPEFVEVMFMAERAGFRVTPVRPDSTVREAEYILNDCGAKVIIVDTTASEQLVEMIRARTCTVKLWIGTDAPSGESYEATLTSTSPHPFESSRVGIPMFYTSGTTGRPKGVYRNEPVSRSAMAAVAAQLKLASNQDLALAPVALCRSGIFNLSVRIPLVCGVPVVLADESDPHSILQLISRHGVTYAYLTPLIFYRLLQLPQDVRDQYHVASLRNVLHTGAPCPVPIKRAMINWLGAIFTECYAGTEGGDIVISSEDWLIKPGSVGKADERVIILNEAGNMMPANQVGRIFLTAPERGRFEYFNDPEKTSAAYFGDHYTLGDHGYLDQDGYLYVTGRTAELINSGGLNIYPAEIDAVLLDHPAVEDVACIGVPNSEMGEEVKALVKLRPGKHADSNLIEALATLCRNNLAPYKCPSSFAIVDDLPRLVTGKLLREQLRQQYQ
jgi:long-chain acyl-CoA synthetase